jgi:hypothetical protein
MITQIYHKKNELQEVEFFTDKECTQYIERITGKDIYIDLQNGDITPLMKLERVVASCNIYTPMQKISIYSSNFNTFRTLDDITPNLSKYIPEDNAVLFLSGEQGRQYDKLFQLNWFYHFVDEDYETSIDCQFINQSSVSESMQESEEMLLNEFYNLPKNIIPSKQFTIFLPHGTQSELQKAEEIEKELKEKYGVEEVNLCVLHWFAKEIYELKQNKNGSYTSARKYDFNKIITTNSTGILRPKDSSGRLQVIDCKEIFEEYLKENNN